jgi:hypothetical protein
MPKLNRIFFRYLNNRAFIASIIFLTPLFFTYLSWNSLILDHHGYRQTQTALSTFWIPYSENWLNFITPVFGEPWSVPLEYPIYQIVVSFTANYLQLTLEESARIITLLSFYLAVLPISYLMRGRIRDNLSFYAFYFSSPILLFFSHTFLIESFSFLLSISVLSSFIFYTKNNSFFSGVLFIIIGSICGLQKITGLMAALIGCGIYSVFFLSTISRSILLKNIVSHCMLYFLAILLPVSWVLYTDNFKSATYILNFLTSDSLSNWNYGNITQRLDPYNLLKLFGFRMIFIGGLTILILRLFLYNFNSLLNNIIPIACIFIGLFGPLVFFNLYIVHDYYMVASLGFIGFGLHQLIDRESPRFNFIKKDIHFAKIIFITNMIIFSFWYLPKINQIPNSHKDMYKTALALKEKVAKEDVILTLGVDWDSTIPYYSERYALMIPSWQQNDFAPMHNGKYFDALYFLTNIQDSLLKRKLGAIVICEIRKAEGFDEASEYILNNWKLNWQSIGSCVYGVV